MTGMEQEKARHNKDRAEAFEKYKNFSKRLSKMMKEESIKMQSKLDKMNEFEKEFEKGQENQKQKKKK